MRTRTPIPKIGFEQASSRLERRPQGVTRCTDVRNACALPSLSPRSRPALTVSLLAAPACLRGGCLRARERPASEVTKRALVRATLCVLNAERARHSLRPLRLNRKLSTPRPASTRAPWRGAASSHTTRSTARPSSTASAATGYLAGARSWSVGENIAYGSGSRSSPRSIGTAWMNSPPHRANILSRSFREIGIGLARGTPVGSGGATYTTDFGRRG